MTEKRFQFAGIPPRLQRKSQANLKESTTVEANSLARNPPIKTYTRVDDQPRTNDKPIGLGIQNKNGTLFDKHGSTLNETTYNVSPKQHSEIMKSPEKSQASPLIKSVSSSKPEVLDTKTNNPNPGTAPMYGDVTAGSFGNGRSPKVLGDKIDYSYTNVKDTREEFNELNVPKASGLKAPSPKGYFDSLGQDYTYKDKEQAYSDVKVSNLPNLKAVSPKTQFGHAVQSYDHKEGGYGVGESSKSPNLKTQTPISHVGHAIQSYDHNEGEYRVEERSKSPNLKAQTPKSQPEANDFYVGRENAGNSSPTLKGHIDHRSQSEKGNFNEKKSSVEKRLSPITHLDPGNHGGNMKGSSPRQKSPNAASNLVQRSPIPSNDVNAVTLAATGNVSVGKPLSTEAHEKPPRLPSPSRKTPQTAPTDVYATGFSGVPFDQSTTLTTEGNQTRKSPQPDFYAKQHSPFAPDDLVLTSSVSFHHTSITHQPKANNLNTSPIIPNQSPTPSTAVLANKSPQLLVTPDLKAAQIEENPAEVRSNKGLSPKVMLQDYMMEGPLATKSVDPFDNIQKPSSPPKIGDTWDWKQEGEGETIGMTDSHFIPSAGQDPFFGNDWTQENDFYGQTYLKEQPLESHGQHYYQPAPNSENVTYNYSESNPYPSNPEITDQGQSYQSDTYQQQYNEWGQSNQIANNQEGYEQQYTNWESNQQYSEQVMHQQGIGGEGQELQKPSDSGAQPQYEYDQEQHYEYTGQEYHSQNNVGNGYSYDEQYGYAEGYATEVFQDYNNGHEKMYEGHQNQSYVEEQNEINYPEGLTAQGEHNHKNSWEHNTANAHEGFNSEPYKVDSGYSQVQQNFSVEHTEMQDQQVYSQFESGNQLTLANEETDWTEQNQDYNQSYMQPLNDSENHDPNNQHGFYSMDTLASAGIPQAFKWCMPCEKQYEMDSNFCGLCGTKLEVIEPVAENVAEQNYIDEQSALNQNYDNFYQPEPHNDSYYFTEQTTAYDSNHYSEKEPVQSDVRTDPLGRDRGHSVFAFGFGGQLLISVPKRQNMYQTTANGSEMIEKVFPGPVIFKSIEAIAYPELLNECKDVFGTGPICTDSKPNIQVLMTAIDDLIKKFGNRNEDILVIMKYIKNVILVDKKNTPDTSGAVLELLNVTQSAANGSLLDQLQNFLLRGAREDACRFALANHMWVEALIIASHVNQKVYADIVTEYLSRNDTISPQVSMTNHPGLKILFALFGGVESAAIMKSFASNPSFTDSILKNWNLILGIIVMNRTSNDTQFLQMFSRILFDANLVGAGQLCSFLAHGNNSSALDAAHPKRMLINSHQDRNPTNFYKNVLSLRLTEIYESLFIAGNGPRTPYPHFQVYKLWLVSYLIDLGMVDLALSYLKSISYLIKGWETNNPHISPSFVQQLRESTDRLVVCCSVINHKKGDQGTGGWLGKISSNLTGAALGRGLEQLMNSAVGVEESVATTTTGSKRKTLYPLPWEEVDLVPSLPLGSSNVGTSVITPSYQNPQAKPTAFVPNESFPSISTGMSPPKQPQLMQYQPQLPFYPNDSVSHPTSHENSHDSLKPLSVPNLSPNMKAIQHAPVASSYKPLSYSAHQENTKAPPNPPPPVAHAPIQKPEDEDLGFGNSALKKDNVVPLPPQVEKVEESTPKQTDQAPKPEKVADDKEQKVESRSSIFSSLGSVFGIFGKKDEGQPQPVKAHLPSGSSFYYDPETKKWVNKKASGSKEEDNSLPPPPIPVAPAPTPNPTPSVTPAPSAVPSRNASPAPLSFQPSDQGGTPLPSGNKQSAKRRTARSRYVDVINPDAAATPAPQTIGTFIPSVPSSQGGEAKMMVPKPLPGQQTSSYIPATEALPQELIQDNSDSLNAGMPPRPPSTSNHIPSRPVSSTGPSPSMARKSKPSRQGAPPADL